MQDVITDIDSVMAEEGGINPGEFIGKYEELKGDAYRLLDDVEQARYGYIAALRTATLDRRLVQLKLDDLGPPPAKFAGENYETTKEESE
ncbi:MAG: tetratricopeptide repeat protein [Alcanivoracaceae bacterium]|nr:tetratricopeptide repeat protein [Alcanivoracaceae bacterium]